MNPLTQTTRRDLNRDVNWTLGDISLLGRQGNGVLQSNFRFLVAQRPGDRAGRCAPVHRERPYHWPLPFRQQRGSARSSPRRVKLAVALARDISLRMYNRQRLLVTVRTVSSEPPMSWSSRSVDPPPQLRMRHWLARGRLHMDVVTSVVDCATAPLSAAKSLDRRRIV